VGGRGAKRPVTQAMGISWPSIRRVSSKGMHENRPLCHPALLAASDCGMQVTLPDVVYQVFPA